MIANVVRSTLLFQAVCLGVVPSRWQVLVVSVDLAASNLDLKCEEAQGILRTLDPLERLNKVNVILAREIQLLTMQQEISSQARGEMDKSQRDYFLRQQLKAIRDELGEGEDLSEDVANYRRLADEKGFTDEAHEELERQIKKLERTHPDSAETAVLRKYLDWLTGRGVAPNVASFVGATTVRIHVLGYEDRAPTDAELDEMRALVARAMEEGALGVGSSLIYSPAYYAGTDELIALAEVAGDYGGMYISHIRGEGNRLLENVEEHTSPKSSRNRSEQG